MRQVAPDASWYVRPPPSRNIVVATATIEQPLTKGSGMFFTRRLGSVAVMACARSGVPPHMPDHQGDLARHRYANFENKPGWSRIAALYPGPVLIGQDMMQFMINDAGVKGLPCSPERRN